MTLSHGFLSNAEAFRLVVLGPGNNLPVMKRKLCYCDFGYGLVFEL